MKEYAIIVPSPSTIMDYEVPNNINITLLVKDDLSRLVIYIYQLNPSSKKTFVKDTFTLPNSTYLPELESFMN
jgi:hypothetical protein